MFLSTLESIFMWNAVHVLQKFILISGISAKYTLNTKEITVLVITKK